MKQDKGESFADLPLIITKLVVQNSFLFDKLQSLHLQAFDLKDGADSNAKTVAIGGLCAFISKTVSKA